MKCLVSACEQKRSRAAMTLGIDDCGLSQFSQLFIADCFERLMIGGLLNDPSLPVKR